MTRLALVGLAFLAIAAPAHAACPSTIVYGHGAVAGGQESLPLDLYRPQGKGVHPVVVLIHGGGFVTQSRTDAGVVRVARGLAARGIVVASIDYRLAASDPQPSARMRPLLADAGDGESAVSRAVVAAVDDTLTAVRYLRRHAKALRIDVRRLGLVGASAGAFTANHVAYVLDDYGIAGPQVRFVGDLWGGIVIGDASQLAAGDPPLFAVHGDADPIVPVALDDALVARARDQHVRTEYHRLTGAGHGYEGSGFFDDPAYPRLLRFARRALAK